MPLQSEHSDWFPFTLLIHQESPYIEGPYRVSVQSVHGQLHRPNLDAVYMDQAMRVHVLVLTDLGVKLRHMQCAQCHFLPLLRCGQSTYITPCFGN